ncbi:hypothetical protein NX774_07500 [Massilia agilis]|uniref:Uncharacterized protein n=1 Tax=Massilia agilis TaxID=1811226 RepID=A0ABT2D9E0_9BURK|nr:hypothetical protein [Massilia agilis]MCS0807767.1 hypothetical protein [Massilia agilis]
MKNSNINTSLTARVRLAQARLWRLWLTRRLAALAASMVRRHARRQTLPRAMPVLRVLLTIRMRRPGPAHKDAIIRGRMTAGDGERLRYLAKEAPASCWLQLSLEQVPMSGPEK